MSDPKTYRILELDGGGERGYISVKFFQRFIQQWGINQADIWKNFDVICGTSIGGILALAYAIGKTPDELESFFTEQGPLLFSTNGTPSDKASSITKAIQIALDQPFYPAGDGSYGADVLTSTINSLFGTKTLQDVKTNVLIPSYQYDTGTYVLFSNLNYAEFIGQNELIANVALSTSAAPLYLPSAIFGGHTYIDGGVYQNNPAAFGRTMGKVLKPTSNRACVLSVGTGIGDMGFEDSLTLFKKLSLLLLNPTPQFNVLWSRIQSKFRSTQIKPSYSELYELFQYANLSADAMNDAINMLVKLFDIAMTGGQESVAKALSLEANYTLNQLYYYRFQPYLDPAQDTELDTTDPATLAYYETAVDNEFNSEIDEINNFIGHLTA